MGGHTNLVVVHVCLHMPQSSLGGEVVIPGLTTVITEVALPAAVRLRNIEETERMKRALLGGWVRQEICGLVFS